MAKIAYNILKDSNEKKKAAVKALYSNYKTRIEYKFFEASLLNIIT